MHKLRPKSFFIGQNQVYLPICHSTNDEANIIGQNGEFVDGTVFITDFQQKGRGQRGTLWEGETGQNLMMSILIDTADFRLSRAFELSMATALSIISAIKSAGLNEVLIKWPNDIYFNNKKLGGILIENNVKGQSLNYSVIGVGINVAQTNFDNPNATSLKKCGLNISREQLAEYICEHFEKLLIKLKKGDGIKEDYLANLLGLGLEREFKYKDELVSGIIRGVNDAGQLELDSELEKKYFDIKEIQFCL